MDAAKEADNSLVAVAVAVAAVTATRALAAPLRTVVWVAVVVLLRVVAILRVAAVLPWEVAARRWAPARKTTTCHSDRIRPGLTR